MSKAIELYEKLTDSIKGGIKGQMFGCPCIKAKNGKAAFCLRKNDLVIKLDKKDEQDALAHDGNELFAPMGRPMGGGWIQIPLANADTWKKFALRSFAFVEKLEANATKAKKVAIKKAPAKKLTKKIAKKKK